MEGTCGTTLEGPASTEEETRQDREEKVDSPGPRRGKGDTP